MSLTIRQKFAESAMKSIISNAATMHAICDYVKENGESFVERIAELAVDHADALIKELENE